MLKASLTCGAWYDDVRVMANWPVINERATNE